MHFAVACCCGPIALRVSPLPLFPFSLLCRQSSADDFFLQCNGKCFNSFEESFCRVVFVATATFDLASPTPSPSPTSARAGTGAATIPPPAFDTSTTPNGGGGSSSNGSVVSPPPPPLRAALRFSPIGGGGSGGSGHGGGGATGAGGSAAVAAGAGVGGGLLSPEKGAGAAWEYDASACVICMDRMESRVLTTVCNHSFHVECLMKWQDSPCPVCRFHHNNASEASTCQVREIEDRWDMWSCDSVRGLGVRRVVRPVVSELVHASQCTRLAESRVSLTLTSHCVCDDFSRAIVLRLRILRSARQLTTSGFA